MKDAQANVDLEKNSLTFNIELDVIDNSRFRHSEFIRALNIKANEYLDSLL